ncbi:Predicted regulator of rRNA gene transcription (MYB-binding protein) [Phaffia rhodozyma]|uniref:Predicted regulator of rRNA gene transcription (MYB-binding protein) n=1 Tax=Phaffia rhodozyma TaxID=264483 RepID=A0A0F7SIG4_PHARH|nr:Predicted regulator of rRNA gene transcription (MYB-binding protein) [Phaffia rhodozyma]
MTIGRLRTSFPALLRFIPTMASASTVGTTLPLFWDLSSSVRSKRLSSSAQLIQTLQHFQTEFESSPAYARAAATPLTSVPPPIAQDEQSDEAQDADDDDEDDDEEDEPVDKESRALDAQLEARNSEDVSYSIKRLVRGLASPRESSRLGFAVALTELLSHLTTITPTQIISLVLRYSRVTVSTKGQETRDLLFARLFGLTTVVQSGLLYGPTASIANFQTVVRELALVSGEKVWLRESCWWSVLLALEGLEGKKLDWKEEATEWIAGFVLGGGEEVGGKEWTPEKVAVTLRLQASHPNLPFKTFLLPPFKSPSLLHASNLPILARILKEASVSASAEEEDDEEDGNKSGGTGSWKPHPHFVWDMILDRYFPKEKQNAGGVQVDKAPFSEFWRVVVDDSLFDAKSSSERKFWGFQIFEKTFPRLPASEIPLVFTPNFMRTWINNLGGEERYLHKAALSIAKLVQSINTINPTAGFTLVSQLLGKNGNQNFDKITKTKTVSSILSSLTIDGVKEYIDFLKGIVHDGFASSSEFDLRGLEARRIWAFDQLVALIRNGSIPKDDSWVTSIIEFFVLHGLYKIKSANPKSPFVHLHTAPQLSLSDNLHAYCRSKLSLVLSELTSETTLVKDSTGKAHRSASTDSTGTLWVTRALSIAEELERDKKHLVSVTDAEKEIEDARKDARIVVKGLKAVQDEKKEAAKGLELLIQSVILQSFDEPEDTLDILAELKGCAEKMFSTKKTKTSKKTAAATNNGTDEPEDLAPIDLLVDVLIGFMERSSAQLRTLATQVFGMLSGEVSESTIDLLLAQLEERPVTAEDDEDDEMKGEDDDEAEEDEDDEEDEEDEEEDDEEDEGDVEVDPELRKRIAEALQVNGADTTLNGADDDSDDDDDLLMNDDQMLALDDQLAEIFKSQVVGKKGNKDAQREAVHFKNRVLEIVETFAKKQPSNALILRLFLPLLELVLNSSPTEQHLSSKATGILNRICRAKEDMEIVDRSEAVEVLEELHNACRKAQSLQVAKTCSTCSMFVSRALLHDRSTPSSSNSQDLAQPILDVYKASLEDFMTKKSTKIRPVLFSNMFSRFPSIAWALRDPLVAYAKSDGANSFRRTQAFLILNELTNQVSVLSKQGLDSEIRAFVLSCREAIFSFVEASCDPSSKSIKADRLRDVLKFAVKLAKSTSPMILPEDRPVVWSYEFIPALVVKVKESDRFKSSSALHSLMAQLMELASGKAKNAKEKKELKKNAKKTEDVEMKEAEEDESKSESNATPTLKRKSKKEGLSGEAKTKKKPKKDTATV